MGTTRVFGLTGGIASGKSTVAERLRQHGVLVIDADVLAREAVLPGTAALEEIRRTFGEHVIAADMTLDRKAVGELVFNDAEAREKLNAIVHPQVGALFRKRVAEATERGVPLVCYDVPLLYERGLDQHLHPVVVVRVSPELQCERLMRRSGLSEAQARARIAAQMPLQDKARRADFVIDNDGSIEQTREQVDSVLQQIRAGFASE